MSTQFGLPVKAVQCDNGREFDNTTSRAFFLSHRVQLRMSCPYTSSQNGKAERMIRTTTEIMRTLLLQASLPARFWAESLQTSTYLLHRLPSAACPAPTPHHALFGTPPRYDDLRVFGCACYPNTTATAPTSWHPVRLSVSSSGTPRTIRGTGAMILPLVGSSSLAMWYLMSLSSLSPPPPRLPPLTSTSSRRVPLTRWPSHLYCFL